MLRGVFRSVLCVYKYTYTCVYFHCMRAVIKKKKNTRNSTWRRRLTCARSKQRRRNAHKNDIYKCLRRKNKIHCTL